MATDSITLINKVLLGLRKDQLNTATTTLAGGPDYPKLILQWLNQAKNDVEEAWDWNQQKSSVDVTGVGAQFQYTLISSGDSNTTVPNNSRLVYENIGPQRVARCHDITDSDQTFRLEEKGVEWISRQNLEHTDKVTEPLYFSVGDLGGADDNMRFQVHGKPSGVRTWRLRFYIVQAALSETALTTVLEVPGRPVWLRALFYANQERGEEAGRPGSELDKAATDALTHAIARQGDDDTMTSNWE